MRFVDSEDVERWRLPTKQRLDRSYLKLGARIGVLSGHNNPDRCAVFPQPTGSLLDEFASVCEPQHSTPNLS